MVQSPYGDRLAAADAGAEVATFDPRQGGIDAADFGLPPAFGLPAHRLELKRVHARQSALRGLIQGHRCPDVSTGLRQRDEIVSPIDQAGPVGADPVGAQFGHARSFPHRSQGHTLSIGIAGGRPIDRRQHRAKREAKGTMTTVYFITNRNRIAGRAAAPTGYGRSFNEAGVGAFRVGFAEVSDDADRAPAVTTFGETLRVDPRRHKPGSDRLFWILRGKMGRHDRDTLVFLHGYNVSFQEALRAAAALKRRWGAAGRPVNVVVVSWPSDGLAMPFASYYSDREDARASGPAIARALLIFAEKLAGQGVDCDRRIHLMAHSMGSFVLRHAVQYLRKEPLRVTRGYRAADTPGGFADAAPQGRRQVTIELPRVFHEIFLMAADEDADALQHEDKLKLLPRLGRRVSVYFNRGDQAMTVSDLTKANPDRLGADGPENPRLVPANVALVDCSPVVEGVIEHGYYLDPRVVEDCVQVARGVPTHRVEGREYVPHQNGFLLTP